MFFESNLDKFVNLFIRAISLLLTCFTVILPDTVILIGTIGVEPQFIKYDDSDSDIKNIKYLLCDVSRS